jgi:carboxypeptidase family protein
VAAVRGVVKGADGMPLAGVSVALAGAPVATPDIAQLTGADGSFALGAPVPGTYVVGVTAPDGETRRVEVTVGEGEPDPVEVSLGGGGA